MSNSNSDHCAVSPSESKSSEDAHKDKNAYPIHKAEHEETDIQGNALY